MSLLKRWLYKAKTKLRRLTSAPAEKNLQDATATRKHSGLKPTQRTPQPTAAAPLTLAQRKQQHQRKQQRQNIEKTLRTLEVLADCAQKAGVKVRPIAGKSLAQIAAQYKTAVPDNKVLLAQLLSTQAVKLNLELRSYGGAHADAIKQMSRATGQNLGITELTSSKDTWTHRCEVKFQHQGKPMSWSFNETGLYFSKSFLSQMVSFIEQQADGKFHVLKQDDGYVLYLFVSRPLAKGLRNLKAEAQ